MISSLWRGSVSGFLGNAERSDRMLTGVPAKVQGHRDPEVHGLARIAALQIGSKAADHPLRGGFAYAKGGEDVAHYDAVRACWRGRRRGWRRWRGCDHKRRVRDWWT